MLNTTVIVNTINTSTLLNNTEEVRNGVTQPNVVSSFSSRDTDFNDTSWIATTLATNASADNASFVTETYDYIFNMVSFGPTKV